MSRRALVELTEKEIDEEISRDNSDEEYEDNIEADVLYDSDIDEDYIPLPSDNDSESDESGEEQPRRKMIRLHPPSHSTRRKAIQGLDASTSGVPAAMSAVPTNVPANVPSVTPANVPTAAAPTNVPTATAAAPANMLAAPATAPGNLPATAVTRRKRHHDESPIVTFQTSTITSTSGYRWSSRAQSLSATRTAARNIMPAFTPGPTREAANADTPEKCFLLLFEKDIIDEIVTWTNARIDIEAAKYKKKTATLLNVTAAEVRALLGIIIFSGCQRDNHLSTKEMWSPSCGAAMYRAAMSESRFSFLVTCLRFDNRNTREQRQATDKFAPIRKIWDIFIANCGKFYIPKETITVDEQLLAFRGRCPFRMYIPNKPAKYGIKLVLANDVHSKYLLAGIPYLGKQAARPQGGLQLGHYYTKELTKQYHHTNRNVTTDNWFTSVPLLTDLLDNCGMTIVGTVKGNKKEIPREMVRKEDRMPGSTAFLFTKKMTLVSYLPATQAKKKVVLLLSSMHTQAKIEPSGKPEVVVFYNQTKGGVDTFDQMCSQYSCGRKTKRWPLCIFYGMINACVINSWIIHSENIANKGGVKMIRRKYMQELALELIKPWAEQRLMSPQLSRTLRDVISTVCNLPIPATAGSTSGPVVAASSGALVRCVVCPSRSDRKTRHRCHLCHRPVCPRHYYPSCTVCIYKM